VSQRLQRGVAHSGGQGLTAQEAAAAIARQGGVCGICGRVPLDRWEIDHDHDLAVAEHHPHDPTKGCKKCFRGVLCRPCNSMLGFAHDDPAVLRRAAAYIELARER
jgi:hypothetical protein